MVVLKNNRGMTVTLCDYGARIVSLLVPDREGSLTDVVLGFNSLSEYISANEQYHGATIGRFANRIANGRFTINGETFYIKPNNGPNALHGGANGFHNRVWDQRVSTHGHVEFYYVSADGEEGFPGKLTVTVEYRLTADNALEIGYRAETEKPTVINLTNHAYFNLNGEGNGNVLNHLVQLTADHYLPIDNVCIPTGAFEAVANTPFDFREPKPIGQDIGMANDQLTKGNGGYDHNYVLNPEAIGGAVAAYAVSPSTGIRMEVLTTEPGIQFYTSNHFDDSDTGKLGSTYARYGAFCFETQHFPDSPNQPEFPSTLLLPGQVFTSKTVYRFGVAD